MDFKSKPPIARILRVTMLLSLCAVCYCNISRTTSAEPQLAEAMDLLCIIDASDTLGPVDFLVVKVFIQDLIDFAHVGKCDLQVAIMTMGGNTSSLQWNLQSKKTRNKKKLLKSIQKLSLKGGSFGSYRRALMVAVRRVWGSKRDRDGAPNVTFLIATSATTEDMKKLAEAAQKLCAKSFVMVYPLGREVSHSVLRTLDCGSNRNFYVVRSFDEMKAILSAVLNPIPLDGCMDV